MTKPQLIFVVDDEADARELVGDYLRMHGFEVELIGERRPALRLATPAVDPTGQRMRT